MSITLKAITKARILRILTSFHRQPKCYRSQGVEDEPLPLRMLSRKMFEDPIGRQTLPLAHYGGIYIVTMIPGFGIGYELMGALRDVFGYLHAPVSFEIIHDSDKTEDIQDGITSIIRNGICIKGNFDKLATDDDSIYAHPNIAIRKILDLYCSYARVKSYKGIGRFENLDIVIIRQNTEGEYSRLEHEAIKGVVESMKIITRHNSERIAHWACLYCLKNKRKKITVVHKANIMKVSDGLFLKTVKSVAKKHYPQIQINDMIVDNCSMQMVSNPYQFDILVTPNLYGLVLANILAGLCGGPGIISSGNYSDKYAVFEAIARNSAKNIAGKNIANPVAILNCGIDLLRHCKEDEYANTLDRAVEKTVVEDKIWTPDLGGHATTTDMVESIKDNINYFRRKH